MLNYRLFFLNPRTGHIMRFAEYEARDDVSAIVLTREHEGAHALELWCDRRKVTRIEPADPALRIAARWRSAREMRSQSPGSAA